MEAVQAEEIRERLVLVMPRLVFQKGTIWGNKDKNLG